MAIVALANFSHNLVCAMTHVCHRIGSREANPFHFLYY